MIERGLDQKNNVNKVLLLLTVEETINELRQFA